MSKNDSVFTMPVAELQKNAERVRKLLEEVGQLLPGLVTMTEDDRRHSDGKTRTGEAEALQSVADVADYKPQYFAALADKDGGVDPKRFETDMLRDHLVRRNILAGIVDASQAVATSINDTMLTLGEQFRPVLLAAYQIAKPIAMHDDAIKSKLAPALDFYGRIGRQAARTRTAKPVVSEAKQ